jgi:hypothetical protein
VNHEPFRDPRLETIKVDSAIEFFDFHDLSLIKSFS